MGTISITLPIKVHGSFRVKDKKAAKKLVEELEQIAEPVSPIDEIFGLWADRDPKEVDDLMREIRRKNSGRD